MPRRNNRHEMAYEPLDLTAAEVRPKRAPNPFSKLTAGQVQEQNRRERVASQKAARMNGGIDWDVCLVPGCGSKPHFRPGYDGQLRDHRYALPLCLTHTFTVYEQALRVADVGNEFNRAVALDVILYRNDAAAEEHERRKKERRQAKDGDIYFIRIGELIKVGWTTNMWSRLKSYGASAELLVCYPGTRDDETNLHRQLTPARAKGREWYHPGDILNSFIEDALRLYGPPQSFDGLWTEPKQVIRKRKR